MNKSQIFKAAHKLAKSVHVVGECYRVTFGAALKIVIAESKAPKTIEQLAIEAGAKTWEKGTISRIYFNDRSVVAATLGYTVVAKPTYANEMKAGKTNTFLQNGVLHTDCGQVANAFRACGHTVKRI
jgi:hypothetical protein